MRPDFYHAARNGAAVLLQPWHQGLIRLAGADRISWLQGMVTNDVEKLRPQEGTYAAHLNSQGKVVGQMAILVDPDAVWLWMETSNVKKLGGVLERMIVMEDVQSEDQSGNFESITIIGPQARPVLEAWLGEPLQLAKVYDHREFLKCRRVVRDELGYTVWTDTGKSSATLGEIVVSGATTIDEATWNIIRTEAGLPIYGIDIDDTTTLPELGEKGIRYDKGCYIGQEVVARIKYIGHVNRRFMGLVCDEEILPNQRSVVRSNGKDVGYITTCVVSPHIGKAIALGFVNRIAAGSGTRVELSSGDNTVAATVSELPFMPSATWSAD